MHKGRSFLILIALLTALLALPARSLAASPGGDTLAAGPGGPTLLGFTDDFERTALAAPTVQGTSQVARITVWWQGVRNSGWDGVDRAVEAIRASGQRLLITVYGFETPDLAEWTAFLIEMHARYPDLWGVQAWNEPNLANIGGNLSVDEMAAVVLAARQALPGVRLIGPSISPTVPGAAEYQKALYAVLPDDVGVGVNLFTYRSKSGVADVLADFRTAEADGGGAPVYVTEIGFSGGYFSDPATNAAQAFGALRKAGAATVIFYRLLTNPEQTVDWEVRGQFNVLNPDLSPTPIFTALQSAVGDTIPPKVSFRKSSVKSKKHKVTIAFSFADNIAGKAINFTCQLDKNEPAPCTSPVTFKKVKFGKHKLIVTALDAAGNDATFVKKFKLKRH